MRVIDMETWPRREHFEFYRNFGHPHFGMTANVDVTDFRLAVKEQGVSFTLATVYVVARAANAIPEFRYRIRDGGVVGSEPAGAGERAAGVVYTAAERAGPDTGGLPAKSRRAF